MARLAIRFVVGSTLAVGIAFGARPCMAQAAAQPARAANQAELAEFGIDPRDIVEPASGQGLRLQSEADERAEQAILAALARPISVKFAGAPLREVRRTFQSQLGLNILTDEKSLADAGVTEDSTFTLSSNDLTARTVLRQLLSQKELSWVIQGGALVITTSEVAKTVFVMRVYPAADLMLAVEKDGGYGFDFDSLIEVITSTISPASWDMNGGAGSIAPYEASGSLVVTQTHEVHEQIALLLDKLRLARRTQGLNPAFRSSRELPSSEGASVVADAPVEREVPLAAAQPANLSATQPQWRIPHVYH